MPKIETNILVWFRSKDEVTLKFNIQNESFASIKCWITNDSFRSGLYNKQIRFTFYGRLHTVCHSSEHSTLIEYRSILQLWFNMEMVQYLFMGT